MPQVIDLASTYPFLTGKRWVNARFTIFSTSDVSDILLEEGLYSDVIDVVIGYSWDGHVW